MSKWMLLLALLCDCVCSSIRDAFMMVLVWVVTNAGQDEISGS